MTAAKRASSESKRCQDHTADFGVRGADVSADLDPAAIGQARIEQGDVWSGGRNASQRLYGISGFPNDLDVISGIEQVREATPHQLMIIQDEDSDIAVVTYTVRGIDHRSRFQTCHAGAPSRDGPRPETISGVLALSVAFGFCLLRFSLSLRTNYGRSASITDDFGPERVDGSAPTLVGRGSVNLQIVGIRSARRGG